MRKMGKKADPVTSRLLLSEAASVQSLDMLDFTVTVPFVEFHPV